MNRKTRMIAVKISTWPIRSTGANPCAAHPFCRTALPVLLAVATLALTLPLALPAIAAQPAVDWGKAGSNETFKDLPGVKAQDPMSFDQGYTCKTVTVAPRLNRRDTLEDVMPRIVYRCEKDGIVYQGSTPPTSGWYPGVNPRIMD